MADAAEQQREQLNTGTKEVAESHRFDEAALAAWMQANVEGFEGPLDLLLTLSRTQKVDLMQISVLELADQYLPLSKRLARCESNWPPIIWSWRHGSPI